MRLWWRRSAVLWGRIYSIKAAQLHTKFVNIHIPKTAGSSLRQHLSWALGAAHDGKAELIGIDQGADGLSYFDGLKQMFAKRLPEITADGMQVMSGHYRYRDIADLLAPLRTQITLVTFLRDPIERTLSDYFYSTSPRHPGQAAFVATYPTLEAYLRVEGEMHKQLEYLRPHPGASVDETVDSALHNLDFIGLTEQFDADFAQLMAPTGYSFKAMPPSNVNPRPDAMREVRDQHLDQLQEALEFEYKLFDAIKEHRQKTR